jgi:hypothetical protein
MTTVSNTFVLIHVVLSVVGIISGLIMAGGLMSGHYYSRWINTFMFTTILTNVTGFGFPFTTILPAHIIGAISLVVLGVASIALYLKGLAGGWRKLFVATSILALYLNVFVLIAQLLAKIPPLAILAPTPAAPAFAAMQTIAFVIFVILGWVSFNRSK